MAYIRRESSSDRASGGLLRNSRSASFRSASSSRITCPGEESQSNGRRVAGGGVTSAPADKVDLHGKDGVHPSSLRAKREITRRGCGRTLREFPRLGYSDARAPLE